MFLISLRKTTEFSIQSIYPQRNQYCNQYKYIDPWEIPGNMSPANTTFD